MSLPSRREVEAKFAAQDTTIMAELVAQTELPPNFCLQTRDTVSHADTYYDTPAYSLLRAGYALRLRGTPGGVLAGLKSLTEAQPDANDKTIQTRVEIEAPFDGPLHTQAETQWPAVIVDAIASVLQADKEDMAALRPIAHLAQTRQKRAISADTAPDTASLELSLDNVEIFAEPPGDGAAPLATLEEVEVELLDPAAESALQQVTDYLHTLKKLEPVTTSKLERALLAMSAYDPDPLSTTQPGGMLVIVPETPVAEACRLIWREQLMRVLILEHGVRSGMNPEYVHQMRVAIRRMRAADRLFGSYFHKNAVRSLLRRWKQLGARLGAVRDLDVGIENLRRFRKQLAKDERKGLKPLLSKLRRRRADAQAKLVAALTQRDHAEFIAEFDRFCSTPGVGIKQDEDKAHDITPVQVRHTVPSIIVTRFEHVRAYETLLERPEPPEIPVLHALRIEAKYLRYSLEFTRHLLGPEGDQLIAQLKRLQDHLGALNDARIEQQRLLEWQHQLPPNAALATRLSDLETTMARLIADYPPLLSKFVDRKNRTRLAKTLVHL